MSAPQLRNGKKGVRRTPAKRAATPRKTEDLAERLGVALREQRAAIEREAATAAILRALSRSSR